MAFRYVAILASVFCIAILSGTSQAAEPNPVELRGTLASYVREHSSLRNTAVQKTMLKFINEAADKKINIWRGELDNLTFSLAVYPIPDSNRRAADSISKIVARQLNAQLLDRLAAKKLFKGLGFDNEILLNESLKIAASAFRIEGIVKPVIRQVKIEPKCVVGFCIAHNKDISVSISQKSNLALLREAYGRSGVVKASSQMETKLFDETLSLVSHLESLDFQMTTLVFIKVRCLQALQRNREVVSVLEGALDNSESLSLAELELIGDILYKEYLKFSKNAYAAGVVFPALMNLPVVAIYPAARVWADPLANKADALGAVAFELVIKRMNPTTP